MAKEQKHAMIVDIMSPAMKSIDFSFTELMNNAKERDARMCNSFMKSPLLPSLLII